MRKIGILAMRHFQGGFQPESDFGISNWARNLESDQVRFPLKTGSKVVKIKKIKKILKIEKKCSFFYALTTLVALELEVVAQIKKKVDLAIRRPSGQKCTLIPIKK